MTDIDDTSSHRGRHKDVPKAKTRHKPITEDRQCLSATCPEGRVQVDVPVKGQPGLALRVHATTDAGHTEKTWSIRYRRMSDGKQRRLTFGRYPDMGLKAARAEAERLRPLVRDGVDPAGQKSERREADSFQDIVERWRGWADRNKSKNARIDDESMLRVHILPSLGAMKAREIKKADIIELRDAVAAKPDARIKNTYARTTTHRSNRVLELVRSIFAWAIGEALLEHDPTHLVKMVLANEPVRERYLSKEEIAILWHALDNAPRARRHTRTGMPRGESVREKDEVTMTRPIAIASQLALVTGQRIWEIAGIVLTEVDAKGRPRSPEFNFDNHKMPVLIIPGWRKHGRERGRTKNGYDSRVPLSRLALRLIDEARKLAGPNSNWLFPNDAGTGPINHQSPTKAMERSGPALDERGITDFKIHDLRRTAATHMADLGVPQDTIDKILNHAKKDHYNHHKYDREKQEALDAWAAELERITGSNA